MPTAALLASSAAAGAELRLGHPVRRPGAAGRPGVAARSGAGGRPRRHGKRVRLELCGAPHFLTCVRCCVSSQKLCMYVVSTGATLQTRCTRIRVNLIMVW